MKFQMKPRTKFKSIAILVVFNLTFFQVGCSVGTHMESMDQNTKKVADELEAYREYVKTLTEQLVKMSARLEEMAYSLSQLQTVSQDLYNTVFGQLIGESAPDMSRDVKDALSKAKSNPKEKTP